MSRFWLVLAGLAGAAAVALGAYGAHGFGGSALQERWFAIAQTYHALHAVALLAGAALVARLEGVAGRMAQAGLGFIAAGVLLFSGGLYWRALSEGGGPGFMIPLGGLALVMGWLGLAVAGLLAAKRQAIRPEVTGSSR